MTISSEAWGVRSPSVPSMAFPYSNSGHSSPQSLSANVTPTWPVEEPLLPGAVIRDPTLASEGRQWAAACQHAGKK